MMKKKKIFIILGGILFTGFVLTFYKMNSNSHKENSSYRVIKVKKKEPLIFRGSVQPKSTSYLNFDQSLGKISNISVQNGQKVDENEVIATYQNSVIEEQAVEQTQSLEKFNLALTNAQLNFDNAKKKQQELEERLSIVKEQQASIVNRNTDEEIKKIEKSEIDNKVELAQQALDEQKDNVLQAQQSLDSARIDLSSVNNSIEQTKKKVTNTVVSPSKGLVFINDKGKTDASIPYATIVSPETVVKGLVTEYDYNKINVGQNVKINLINGEKSVEGIVTSVSVLPEDENINLQKSDTSYDNHISTFSFVVSPKEFIHYGYNVQISMSSNDLELAKRNVVQENNQFFVYIYKNRKAIKKEIKVKEKNDKYLVENGLIENDTIIDNPDFNIKNGQEVMVDQ